MRLRFNILKATAVCAAVAFHAHAQNPLFIPPTLSGTEFQLNIQTGTKQFFTGINTPTFGINGAFLSPTLIFNKGEVVTLNVTNNLNTSTTMHWHGLHVPAKDDGGPHQIIEAGATWSPQLAVLNDAATYWYHPHGEHKTDLHVSKGLAGLIIIKDTVEAALDLPRTYGVDDFPLIVQSKSFDVLHQIAIATVFDTVMMVNGTRNPSLAAPAQVVRLRLLNGSSDRSYLFGFSNNMNFYQIATDGGLLEQPVPLTRLRLSNGERAEILVNLSSLQGQTIFLMNYGSELADGIIGAGNVGMGMAQIPEYDLNPLNGSDFNILEINVAASTLNPVTTIPANLRTLTPWNLNEIDVNRTITLAPQTMGPAGMVEGPFTINGVQFDMEVINITTYLNNVEKWTIDNQTMIAHPFHIHDIQFYINDINGGAVPANERGKKDVVLVMPQQTVSFITKFETFTDTIPYMYHCHLLHHEDDGMMGAFVVLDTLSSSINETNFSEKISVYPNPGTKEINIALSTLEPSVNYILSDITGRIISNSSAIINDNLMRLNVVNLTPGSYFIKITAGSKIFNLKFLKN